VRTQASLCQVALSCVALVAALGGCANTVAYDSAYVAAARRPPAQVVEGRVLVLTERADDKYVYTGNPTSFTGSARTLTIPLGAITREIAATVYGDVFRDGAESSNELKDPARYRLVIRPKLLRYSYEYNQLKNAGFAITPTVRLSMKVSLLRADGQQAWEKTYESGDAEGQSYMVNTSPEEEINKVTHKTVHDVLLRSVADVLPLVGRAEYRPVTQ